MAFTFVPGLNPVRKNGSPPQARSAREIAPGRPITGLVGETRRRDWEKPYVDLAAAVNAAVIGFTGNIPPGSTLNVVNGVITGWH